MPIYKPSSSRQSSSSSVSKPLSVVIERLSDEGRGIAQDKGKKIFVEGGLPGEQLLVVPTRVHRRYSEAKIKTIQQASEHRQTPPCAVFKQCGGCSVQHMPHSQQLEFKQDAVLSQLARWADVVPDEVLPPVAQDEYHYRQRVRLAVDYAKNGDLFLGFREANSRRIVNIHSCVVLVPSLQSMVPLLKQWLQNIKPNIVSHIELIHADSACAIVVRHTRKLPNNVRQALVDLLVSSNTQLWFQGEKGGALEDANGNHTPPVLYYYLKDFSIRLGFHPQDFIQGNGAVNQKMVNQAITLMAPKPHEHIVDLFCGMGNFSLPLAQKAKQVTGIEGVDAMVDRAWDNARANGIDNVVFHAKNLAADTVEWGDIGEVDGLLLDPPRSGAKEICEKIMELAPKRIVYVSCDSATFARDAKLLIANGFRLSKTGVVDMFPQTPHIEVMSLFVRP